MLLEQVHDLVVELLRGLFVADGPVVNVPVVGGQVDQAIVVSQLLGVEVGKVLFGEAKESFDNCRSVFIAMLKLNE